MESRIVIVDYGMGNLRSVQNTFKKLNVDCIISSAKDEIDKANKLILPGVGNFKYGMENLDKLGLIDVLNKKVIEERTLIFGICLGTQLFCKHSEEGNCNGLGWIDAEVIKFRVNDKLRYKVPHIGWNDAQIVNGNKCNSGDNYSKYYFVHSYYLKCRNQSDIWMTTSYEEKFVSAVHNDNIYGTQFHPEKSYDAGMLLLKGFIAL